MAIYRAHVLVCGGTPCILAGSEAVKAALTAEIAAQGLKKEVKVIETGCLGPCEEGPALIVYPEGVVYGHLTPEGAREIVREHLLKGRIVERLRLQDPKEVQTVTMPKQSYLSRQQRVVLKNSGVINPESIEEYIAQDGYAALGKAVSELSPAAVVEIIKESGLRGRGGAGFPTGIKWSFTAATPASQKYIVCNADEGEPGTFKDRLIMEGDPHRVLEGMAIAGYAVGASKGYIYIRGEYHQSIARMEQAIKQARKLGLLGTDIFGSGFTFDVEVCQGAGAYICGEETALLESMEGKRGEPRLKPPYPGVAGLWGKPTVVNNVETLANIAPIILHGAAWFRGIGTATSPGTKVFTLTGDINREGLIEVPMGTTLRTIITELGGGIPGGHAFKMAQTGGSSGGCLPAELLDVPMDYDSLAKAGSALGSGALLIMDDTHCIVDIAKCFARFFHHESCGKCTPCREGNLQIVSILERITQGAGKREDLELLRELGETMQVASFCGLGQSAPNPLLTTLKYFEAEYLAHIEEKKCPTGMCKLNKPHLAVAG